MTTENLVQQQKMSSASKLKKGRYNITIEHYENQLIVFKNRLNMCNTLKKKKKNGKI